jgi:hypothetical protein
MNEPKLLQFMGFAMPSPAYLLGAILFGIAGYIAYRLGKKNSHSTLKGLGIALMLFPYAISQTWLLWGVGIALCGWVYTQWQ